MVDAIGAEVLRNRDLQIYKTNGFRALIKLARETFSVAIEVRQKQSR